MSLYYMPPPLPRPAWPGLSLLAVRIKGLSRESRWVLVGLLLAQVMVFAIYMLLVDNLANIEQKRVALEQHTQERHECAMLDGRLERRQCFVALQLRDSPTTLTMAATPAATATQTAAAATPVTASHTITLAQQ